MSSWASGRPSICNVFRLMASNCRLFSRLPLKRLDCSAVRLELVVPQSDRLPANQSDDGRDSAVERHLFGCSRPFLDVVHLALGYTRFDGDLSSNCCR